MKSKIFWLTISSVILLIGCSASTVVVMDEYSSKKITDKKLTIIKMYETPAISNYDDVLDDIGDGVPELVYNNYFKEYFTASIKNNTLLSQVKYIDDFPKSSLTEKMLAISKQEKFRALLPQEESKIDSLECDFILFIYSISSNRVKGSSGNWFGTPGGVGYFSGGSFPKLFQQLNFAIWDNTNRKLVSYGRVDDESTIVINMTKGNWDSVTRGLAYKVLEASPFKTRLSNNY